MFIAFGGWVLFRYEPMLFIRSKVLGKQLRSLQKNKQLRCKNTFARLISVYFFQSRTASVFFVGIF